MNLSELLALVDGFHITDKRLLRARAAIERVHGATAEHAFRTEVRR